MPDFVYFNHAQHVVAGEQAIISSFNKKNPDNKVDVVCKACHGKVDTMNVVQMANDFTMGWCIECHRTAEVDMTNGYNQAYFTGLHDKLKKQYPKSEGKITVDAIGGLECGKCHY
jgi:ferredoxin-like protein FixX